MDIVSDIPAKDSPFWFAPTVVERTVVTVGEPFDFDLRSAVRFIESLDNGQVAIYTMRSIGRPGEGQ